MLILLIKPPFINTDGAVPQLQSMERSLRLYCSQLSLQCQKLLLSSGLAHQPSSPSPSLAHWQSQLQQLEEEKSQLLEYVKVVMEELLVLIHPHCYNLFLKLIDSLTGGL